MDVGGIVKGYLDKRIVDVLEDVVNKQMRHIVKLAVDRELAVARERTAQDSLVATKAVAP
jgi:hypothetical protein